MAGYDTQLKVLKEEVDANQANLTQRLAELKAAKTELDNQLINKQYEAYNDGVAPYNGLVNDYNALVLTTREKIDEYNRLLAERNAIAIEEQELYQAIDSRPSTTDGN